MAKKKKTGRPASYRPTFPEKAQSMFARGATAAEVAKSLKISISTLYQWQQDKPAFSEAVTRGKAQADELVEQSLFKRSIGYQHPDTHFSTFQGMVTATPFTKHYPPDTAAAVFWLKNRKPKEWRDRTEIQLEQEVAGVDAQTLEMLRKKFRETVGSAQE